MLIRVMRVLLSSSNGFFICLFNYSGLKSKKFDETLCADPKGRKFCGKREVCSKYPHTNESFVLASWQPLRFLTSPNLSSSNSDKLPHAARGGISEFGLWEFLAPNFECLSKYINNSPSESGSLILKNVSFESPSHPTFVLFSYDIILFNTSIFQDFDWHKLFLSICPGFKRVRSMHHPHISLGRPLL